VRSIQQTVDSLTSYENRIRLVSDSAEELNQIQAELFRVARDTRSEFNSTADVYARVALSIRELGIAQSETLQFTESLNQAVILSGASAREANAALVQLGQGLASNRLSGDELRSVLEQLPFVADIIAKSLGATRGELREMGRAGVLTGETVLKAFREARVEIAEKFAQTIPTIAQAFNVFNAEWLTLVDAVDDATGASESVARAIISVAHNMDVLVGSVLTLTGALAGLSLGLLARNFFFLGAAIRFASAALLTLLANPLVLLIAGIGAAIGFISTFGKEIKITEDGLVSLRDAASEAFGLFVEIAEPVLTKITEGFQLLLGTALLVWDRIGGAATVFFTLLGFIAKSALNSLIGLFIGSRDAIVLTFDNLGPVLKDVFVVAFNELIDITQNAINAIIDAIASLFSGIDNLAERAGLGRVFGESLNDVKVNLESFKGEVSGAGSDFAGEFNKGFTDALKRDFVGEVGDALDQFGQEAIRRARRSGFTTTTEVDLGRVGERPDRPPKGAEKVADILRRLENQNALLRVQGLEREKLKAIQDAELKIKRELLDTERQAITSLVEENYQLEAQSDILTDLRGPAEEYANQQRALITLLADGKITVEEFNRELDNIRLTFLKTQDDSFSKFQSGLIELNKSISDTGSQLSDAIGGAFKGIEDVFVEFVKTGKLNFKSLTDSILADFARILIRAVVLRPLLGALGGGVGIPGIPAFQHGGSITVGGSGGPDSQLVVAKASPGERIDFTPSGQQAGGGTTVIVNNNAGANVRQERRSGSGGREIIELTLDAVDGALASGRFDDSMRGRFGSSVRPVRR
jgi:tape measure domain-containing protein